MFPNVSLGASVESVNVVKSTFTDFFQNEIFSIYFNDRRANELELLADIAIIMLIIGLLLIERVRRSIKFIFLLLIAILPQLLILAIVIAIIKFVWGNFPTDKVTELINFVISPVLGFVTNNTYIMIITIILAIIFIVMLFFDESRAFIAESIGAIITFLIFMFVLSILGKVLGFFIEGLGAL